MTLLWRRLHDNDGGSIVFGWLGRVALTLTVLAVAAFEVLSIAITHISLADVGATAADRALTAYENSHDPNQAYLAADKYVTENGAELMKKTFTITNESVSFEVRKTAPTLLLFRVDATAGWAKVKTNVYQEPIVQGSTMS